MIQFKNMKIIVGLGNPDDKYKNTRHNIGRDFVEAFRKKNKFEDWSSHKKSNSLISKGEFNGENITLVLPETYMNNSGKTLVEFVKTKKQAGETLVLHDDLDLGVGKLKISFNKNSGGQKGVDSIIKLIKTKEFPRLRIGIAPVTPSGKIKKVSGEDAVVKHVLSKFKASELEYLKKVEKNVQKGIELFIEKGHVLATNEINSW
jgi:PTH1 family peptidyl-tRNA hydrolase